MLDYACIFTTGGVLLFTKAFTTMKFDPIDLLIKRVLVQDKGSEQKLFLEPYQVRWTIDNNLKIIFAVAYQEIFQLVYVEEFLEMLKKVYREKIAPELIAQNGFYKRIPAFDEQFNYVIQKWEQKQEKNQKKDKIMRSFHETKKGKEIKETDDKKGAGKKKKKNENKEEIKANAATTDEEDDEDDAKNDEGKEEKDDGITAEERAKRALERKFSRKGTKKETKKEDTNAPAQKQEKKKTEWNIPSKNSKNTKGLDFSANFDQDKADEKAREQYLGSTPDGLEGKFIDDNQELNFSSDDDDDDKEESKQTKKGGLFSRLTSAVKNVTGNKVLTHEDLEPVMKEFREGLMAKNVAEEVAQHICKTIESKLIDTKTKAFTSIKKTVQEALLESLTKILTPKRNIDPISEAMRAKEQGRPFVMVFIGVNGVGKSTNLAKVAHLLKKKGGFSVLLAACDNFRAGAVEQIKTHGRCLEVPVFDQGYKSDPALIASAAIKEAMLRKIDCVLIDTAGRMQDNEPLMKALARLVALNQPDLIMFVGEALVGNDAVDQLTKFNKSLVDLSPVDKIREIDAILLTKFDTVDDKVGAAVSMTYSTGKPVLFVGTGQKYTHLRKLNVKTVVNTILN